jgi:hypothetical protein
MEWSIRTRLGNQVGIGIIVWLVILDGLLIWIAAQLPITVITFILVLLALATLPIVALIVYWLLGLNRARYALDRNLLTIHWGAVQQVIPMASIRKVLHGSEIAGRIRRFRGGRWPGHWVGQAQVEDVGPVLFYAADGLDQQLVIVTPSWVTSRRPACRFRRGIRPAPKDGTNASVEQVYPARTPRGRCGLIGWLWGWSAVMFLVVRIHLPALPGAGTACPAAL